MSFKKIRYNSGKEIFEIKIKNSDGSIIGKWVFMKDDFPKWVKIMERKYGIETKEKDRDLDWLK